MLLDESRSRSERFGKGIAAGVLLWLWFAGGRLPAQVVLPPGALQQLDTAIGQRVEATAVLGTQGFASRSGLGWTLNDADGAIYRIPWKAELTETRPLGDSGLAWAPVFEGGVGYGSFINHFNDSVLDGNESSFKTLALSLGAGPRIYFGDSGISVLPAFDLLYAYTENNFTARNPPGQQVVDDGRYVNWNVHTISFVPSFEFRYRKKFGRWTPTYVSGFAWFSTQPISRSTDALSFQSDSMVWANKADIDYLTQWRLLGCPTHLGAEISRTDLYNGLKQAIGTDHYYQAVGRVTFDTLDILWPVDTLGLGGGYFWCGAFNGYSVGLELSLKF